MYIIKMIIEIIIITIIYILIFQKIKVKEKFVENYKINFLNKNECHNIYDNYEAINFYQLKELKYRSKNQTNNRNEMVKLYKKNCMEFTKDEKENLKRNVEKLYTDKLLRFPLLKEWNFLKLSSDFDFGLPYTINDTIILPSHFCNKSDLYETLFHEQFHIIQYQNKDKFDNFYRTKWNFKKVNFPENSWITKNFVTNPDGYKNFYSFNTKNDKFLPLVLLLNSNMAYVIMESDYYNYPIEIREQILNTFTESITQEPEYRDYSYASTQIAAQLSLFIDMKRYRIIFMSMIQDLQNRLREIDIDEDTIDEVVIKFVKSLYWNKKILL